MILKGRFSVEIKEKIKEIYSAHKKSGLYNDSIENVIYRFTNAYDYLFLILMKQSMLEIREGSHNYNRFDDPDLLDYSTNINI